MCNYIITCIMLSGCMNGSTTNQLYHQGFIYIPVVSFSWFLNFMEFTYCGFLKPNTPVHPLNINKSVDNTSGLYLQPCPQAYGLLPQLLIRYSLPRGVITITYITLSQVIIKL